MDRQHSSKVYHVGSSPTDDTYINAPMVKLANTLSLSGNSVRILGANPSGSTNLRKDKICH